MEYVLKSKKTGKYFVYWGNWTDSIIVASKLPNNPIRYIIKAFVSFRYEPCEFKRLIPLKANMSILGKLNRK